MKRKNLHIAQDRIAVHYGMTYEYKTARRNGLTPSEALEDRGLIRPEERALFFESDNTTPTQQNPHCGLDLKSLEQIVEQK